MVSPDRWLGKNAINRSTNEFVEAFWYLRSRKSPGPRTSKTALGRARSFELQPFNAAGNELNGCRAGIISALLRACSINAVPPRTATTIRKRQYDFIAQPPCDQART